MEAQGVMPELEDQTVLSGDAQHLAFLQGVLESNPDGIVVINPDNRLLVCNRAYLALWGTPTRPMMQMSNADRWAHQLAQLENPEVDGPHFSILYSREPQRSRQVFRMKNGGWFERFAYDLIEHGRKSGLVLQWRDMTEMFEAQRTAEYERELLHAMMDSAPDQIFFKDRESHFIRINPSLAKRFSLTDPALAIGKSDADFYSAEHAAKTAEDERRIIESGEPLLNMVDQEFWPDGNVTWNVSTKMPLRNSAGKLIGTYGIAHDITQHKKTEALIWQQANFDPLTGLPNRRLLHDRWEQALKNQQRNGMGMGLLLIDLDHFKEVNDTLGHASGDALLVEASRRICHCVRASDTVARQGGDEFSIILADLPGAELAGDIAQKIVLKLAEPYVLEGEQVYVSASIGIAMSPADGQDLDDLFRHADQAMYLTKSKGRNGVSFYTPELQALSQRRLRLVNDLRQAIAGNQLFLEFQPIVDLKSGHVEKGEALLRWQHPVVGLVSPAEFIPLAESSGQILEIGDWVFREAVRHLCQWRSRLAPGLQISVNKSPVQMHSSSASPHLWHDHLQSVGLPGNALTVEITESLLLDEVQAVQQKLQLIRQYDMQVALDDFGTGYSALAYLQRYAIDYIKIDQSFVRDLHASSKNMALCKAIIRMAHELDMRVIAEGIETRLQCELMVDAGCDFGQGYLFSRPLRAELFEAFVREANGLEPPL